VNCAWRLFISSRSIPVDTSAEDYDELIDTNGRSAFLFTRHTVPVSQTLKEAVDAFGRIDIVEVQMRTMAEALA
jgi:hypothetical protein